MSSPVYIQIHNQLRQNIEDGGSGKLAIKFPLNANSLMILASVE